MKLRQWSGLAQGHLGYAGPEWPGGQAATGPPWERKKRKGPATVWAGREFLG
jgi:hypothetical protein